MFNNDDTDGEWERFGKGDPYFGVCAQERYRRNNLTEDNKEEFFRSGYDHVDCVLKKIKEHIDPNVRFKKALDFGCGVGRLVIPLAALADTVTGVDVSDSMLSEAKKNCKERSISNVSFYKSDDNLSGIDGKFDLIHSFIVFQHIPVSKGERLFEKLISRMEDGGVFVAHFTYAKNYPVNKFLLSARKYLPFSKYLSNFRRGRRLSTPQMQMNSYDLNRLFLIIQKSKFSEFHAEFSSQGGDFGILLYFKKPLGA